MSSKKKAKKEKQRREKTVNVREIDVDLIEQNENSRVVYKESDLTELMASMKEDGLLQPIEVRVLPGGKFDCTFGNRRLMAAKRLGWVKIMASVVHDIDEKTRDIRGLIENMKRQNTSVSEDGRMFQKLMDYGLNKNEIAVRLGVNVNRVETALDVFNHFPADLKKSIMNTGKGVKQKSGTVSASMATHINNMRKHHSLNRASTRKLIQYAAQEGVHVSHLSTIVPLMKAGMTISKAISAVEKIKCLTLQLMVSTEDIDKIEKKFKQSFHNVVYDVIEKAIPQAKRLGSARSGVDFKSREFRANGTKAG